MSRIMAGMSIALAVVVMAGPTWSAGLSCVKTDPAGDAYWELTAVGQPAPAYEDIISAEITRVGKDVFVFSMEMAGEIPKDPAFQLPSVDQISWSFRLDTDPATAPAGFPVAPGVSERFEFLMRVVWDGGHFRGELVDRRPLLEDQYAVIVPMPLKISKGTLSVSVDAEAFGAPSSFEWGAGVNYRLTEQSGNNATSPIDVVLPGYSACPEM